MLLNCGAGEDSWESLGLTARLNQSILKENSPEYSLERLILKLKLQYFGHLMQRADSLEKNPDSEKDWRQKEKRVAEDELVRWHHWLNGYKSEQTSGDGEGRESRACYSPWGRKDLDTTQQLNNSKTRVSKYMKLKVLKLKEVKKFTLFLGDCNTTLDNT